MIEHHFQVTYQMIGSTSNHRSTVRAPSASQAKEIIKARYPGRVRILATVKQ